MKSLYKTVSAAFSAAALLLLSTIAQAKPKQAAPTSTQKYHIAIVNLYDQPVRVGLRKEGDKGRQMHATEFLDAGQNIDRVINRKLNFIVVRGHGSNQTTPSLDPEKGAMFLIERNDAGDSFMVTAFVNDHEGWLLWRDAVARAQAKLKKLR